MKSLEQVQQALTALDLEAIKFKIVKEHGWSLETADKVEPLYKAFLLLKHKYPERSVIPTKAIDEMWHTHILDTLKYAADCDVVFGEFIHHFPYFGARSQADAAELQAAFEGTKAMFFDDLGIDLIEESRALRMDDEALAIALCDCTGYCDRAPSLTIAPTHGDERPTRESTLEFIASRAGVAA